MPDFRSLQAKHKKDDDYAPRTFELQCLGHVLDGTLYDVLGHAFADEKSSSEEYIKLGDRRPSARTRICPTVVNDSVAMLFDDDHFPTIECQDKPTRETLTALVKELGLNHVMIEAATSGSIGSVAVHVRVLKERLFFKVHRTCYLTPEWQPEAPDTLARIVERYKVKGHVLKARGYPIDDKDINETYWFQRIWDESAETWYQPQTVTDAKKGAAPAIDTAKSVEHALGFVPWIWIRNLPGGDDIDGRPTFPREAIDMQIECDYLLSQGGRGLKYQSDPTLVIKETPFGQGSAPLAPASTVKGAANALVVDAQGDAKLLEISGDAAKSMLDWVKGLRELALEGASGNRTNTDKISAAQSGRAMELMHQPLINLASKLRISYGNEGLQRLLEAIVKISNKIELKDRLGNPVQKMAENQAVSLRWPRWFAPTYADMETEALTLSTLRSADLLSRETAVKSLVPTYDIPDVAAELTKIEADADSDAAREALVAKPKSEPISQSED